MSFWSNIYFTNANSPVMEQMVMFHDHSMIVIFSIMVFLTMKIMSLTKNKITYFNLMENQMSEFIWTMLPMLLLMLIAAPSIRLLYLMEEIFNPSITIKTIGHQWYWSYEYSDFNISFDAFMTNSMSKKTFRLLDTDSCISIPLNSSCRMLVTSADVIHSWTIQSLGVKTDAIPGRLNMLNFSPLRPGNYYGQCSEICGSNHSFMPIKINITNFKLFKKMILAKYL